MNNSTNCMHRISAQSLYSVLTFEATGALFSGRSFKVYICIMRKFMQVY